MKAEDKAYIESVIAKHSDKSNSEARSCLKPSIRRMVTAEDIGMMRAGQATDEPTEQPQEQSIKVAAASGGFGLRGKTLIAKKPTDVWRPRFNSLRTETGYYPETLAEQWGVSIATVREKARRHKAVRYTEIDGEYAEIIVHPNTRGGK